MPPWLMCSLIVMEIDRINCISITLQIMIYKYLRQYATNIVQMKILVTDIAF